MAERSIKAGYMKDALKYLEMAHEADPGDFDVMLKLGWTNNILHRDKLAFRWFDLARRSPDPQIAAEGERVAEFAAAAQRFRTTAWLFPHVFDPLARLFAYGQVKTEMQRSAGESLRQRALRGRYARDYGCPRPPYLSESSFILAAGLRTRTWQGDHAWFEAGWGASYFTGHMLPDYRGGVAAARGVGHSPRRNGGWFADATVDGVFVSRFGNDFLVYTQSRAGYTWGRSFGASSTGTATSRSIPNARLGQFRGDRPGRPGARGICRRPCT